METSEEDRGELELPTREGAIQVTYVLERSPRARRLRLTLGEGRAVVMRLPKGMGSAEALRFLLEQGDWVQRAWQKRPPQRTLAEHLVAHPEVTLGGQPWKLVRKAWPLWRARRLAATREVELVGPDHGEADEPLAGLLRGLAADDLAQRVAQLAGRRNLAVAGVTVRDQSTRWGSCSSRGWISLNWRLILLPPPLQDHVIWHELAHLTHLHHRPAFWALLARYDADWREYDRQVTKWGRVVMPLGRMQPETDDLGLGEVARESGRSGRVGGVRGRAV